MLATRILEWSRTDTISLVSASEGRSVHHPFRSSLHFRERPVQEGDAVPMESLLLERNSGRHVQVIVPSMHVWEGLSTRWVAVIGCVQPEVDRGIHTACGSLPPPTRSTSMPRLMAIARFAVRMEIYAHRGGDIRRYND